MSSEQESSNRELTFPVPWGIIAAKTWNDACSPPVLVVHGIQDNAGSFDRLIALLPKAFYYVCIDLPGHGRSSRFPKGVRLDFMLYVSAVNRVVRLLKWDQFYYLGHSLGGQLGTYYASMYPEEVLKLIVLDAVPPAPYQPEHFLKYHVNSTKKLIELENKLLKSKPPSYTYKEALERVIKNRPSPITKEAAEKLIVRSLRKGSNGYYFSSDQRLKFGVTTPISKDHHLFNLSNIKCSFLLVITEILLKYLEGRGDKIIDIYKKNEDFKMVIVEGYHDVHNNEPELIAPIVSKFLIHQKSLL